MGGPKSEEKWCFQILIFIIVFLLVFILFTGTFYINAISIDSTNIENLIPYSWSPISDVDKVLQHENMKNLNKKAIDQTKIANKHYETAIKKMHNKDYSIAIEEFKNAMKRYKRA